MKVKIVMKVAIIYLNIQRDVFSAIVQMLDQLQDYSCSPVPSWGKKKKPSRFEKRFMNKHIPGYKA